MFVVWSDFGSFMIAAFCLNCYKVGFDGFGNLNGVIGWGGF